MVDIDELAEGETYDVERFDDSVSRARLRLGGLGYGDDDIQDLRRVYSYIASCGDVSKVNNMFNGLRGSPGWDGFFELWGKFNSVVHEMYVGIRDYNEFVGEVLGLSGEIWGAYWRSGRRRDVPLVKGVSE